MKKENNDGVTIERAQPAMRVAYVPTHAQWDEAAIERGTISSKNERFVFVKFDTHVSKFGWDGATAQACDPGDLVFI